MKQEGHIIELLTESLKRQDQTVDEIKSLQHTQKADNERVIGAISALTDIVKAWTVRRCDGQYEGY